MMPAASVCGEIGVWKGDSSAQILRVVRPARRTSSTPWRLMTGEAYREARYGGKVATRACCADSTARSREDGVTRAVDEFVEARGYEAVSLAANQFILRTRALSRA
jgi:hypothetical protein